MCTSHQCNSCYWLQMQQHQFLPCFAGEWSSKTHSVWYSILHQWLHFSIAFLSSGILQVQRTWMESAAFNFVCSAVLCCFAVGSANSLPCSRLSCKCFLIFFWSKTTLPGWTTLTNAVAKATANSPQCALPDCIWTSMILRSIVFCSVNKIEAICCFTNGVTEQNKLSYTNTSASFVAPIIVLIVSQCPWPSAEFAQAPLSRCWMHIIDPSKVVANLQLSMAPTASGVLAQLRLCCHSATPMGPEGYPDPELIAVALHPYFNWNLLPLTTASS